MSKEESRNDFIINDPEFRDQLLALLISKWSDPNSEPLIKFIIDQFMDTFRTGDARLRDQYPKESYNRATGRKSVETPEEWGAAYDDRIKKGLSIIQSRIGEAIYIAIMKAIEVTSHFAARKILTEMEKEIKKAEGKRKRNFNRSVLGHFGIVKPIGRPPEYKKSQVEQRTIAIIRIMNPALRQMGRIAAAFYGDFDESRPNERERHLSEYLKMSRTERQKRLTAFSDLLARKGLDYEELRRIAKDKSNPRK